MTGGQFIMIAGAGLLLYYLSQQPAGAVPAGGDVPVPPFVPPSPPRKRILKRGMRGDDVKALQQALNVALKAAIQVDGVFGKNTEDGVLRFQLSRGIKADGIVGPMTAKLLGI